MLAGMPNIGPLELIVVLVVVLLVVGPKKLPGLGRSLGTGMREFKDSVSGSDKSDDHELEAHRQAVAPVQPPAAPVAEPAPLQKQPEPADPAAPPHRDAE